MQAFVMSRTATQSRSEFIIKPRKAYQPGDPVTNQDTVVLTHVLNILKPAGMLLTLDMSGTDVNQEVPMSGIASDGDYWEVVPRVTPVTVAGYSPSPYPASDVLIAQQGPSAQPTFPAVLPKPPLSEVSGEEWSYAAAVASVTSYGMVVGPDTSSPGSSPQMDPTPDWQSITLPSGATVFYSATAGLVDARTARAARVAGDGIMVAHPYTGSRVVLSV
jgi:hypothetical protein